MKKSTAVFWGIILVVVGVLLILVQLDFIENIKVFSWQYLWPGAMILLGALFHVWYFTGTEKSTGLLVPGGILLVYGCLFMYNNFAGWGSLSVLWPIFLVGPGFGLMELKLFSRGKEGSWVPVIVLFTLAILFFIKQSFASFAIAAAVALIIGGVLIIVSAAVKGKKPKVKVKTKDEDGFE